MHDGETYMKLAGADLGLGKGGFFLNGDTLRGCGTTVGRASR